MKHLFSGSFDPMAEPVQDTARYHLTPGSIRTWCWGIVFNAKELGWADQHDPAEIIATLYERNGLEGLAKADGRFTALITTPSETILVRDHHGAGPTVFHTDRHFATSVRLLTERTGTKAEPDHQALSMFLERGYVPVPRTAFKNIRKLGAGMALVSDRKGLRAVNLFPTEGIQPVAGTKTLEEYADEYGRLHVESIRRRIEGAENVGILLSGGYDSGSNLAALRSIHSGTIHSFSIGFKGDNWSELPLARCMSEAFGTLHNEYEIDGSEIGSLQDIVEFLGDPFVEGGLMVNYTVMKMVAGNRPDIILGGDGSDQYFGTSGREVAVHQLLHDYGAMPLARLMHGMLGNKAFDNGNSLYRIQFQLDKIIGVTNGDFFGLPGFLLRNMVRDRSFLPPKGSDKPDTRSFEHLYLRHQYETDIEKTINQVILFKAARMAEMFDNDIAFPFMDHQLYQFLQELPVQYKFRTDSLMQAAKGNLTTKFLLKHHYKPLLPKEITSKKKQGGFAPMPLFFDDTARRKDIKDYILSSGLVKDFLKRGPVEEFLSKYDREAGQKEAWFWYRQNKAIQYFNLYTLALWWETFVNDGHR